MSVDTVLFSSSFSLVGVQCALLRTRFSCKLLAVLLFPFWFGSLRMTQLFQSSSYVVGSCLFVLAVLWVVPSMLFNIHSDSFKDNSHNHFPVVCSGLVGVVR